MAKSKNLLLALWAMMGFIVLLKPSIVLALSSSSYVRPALLQLNRNLKCHDFIASDFDNPAPGITWAYCVTLNYQGPLKLVRANSSDLLYYLHGAGMNEFGFDMLGVSLFKGIAKPPTVVTITFKNEKTVAPIDAPKSGKGSLDLMGMIEGLLKKIYGRQTTFNSWLLAKDAPEVSTSTGLEDVFVTKIKPYIESLPEIRFDSRKGKRILMGSSMGGANAINLALDYPQIFSRVVIQAAAVFEVSPLSGLFDQYYQFIHRGGQMAVPIAVPRSLYGTYSAKRLPDFSRPDSEEMKRAEEHYHSLIDPFEKINQLGFAKPLDGFPEMYFSVTSDDELFYSNCAIQHKLRLKLKEWGIQKAINFEVTRGMHIFNLLTDPALASRLSGFLSGKSSPVVIAPYDENTCLFTK